LPGGGFSAGDFEFVEIQNTGTSPKSLNGVNFDDGISYTFGNVTLGPGEHVAVAKNINAFRQRYGLTPPVVGPFTGSLSDSGESIVLEAADGTVLQSFTYQGYWYSAAAGGGHSLVIRQATGTASLDLADSWHASASIHGSPGAADVGLYPGAVVINEVFAHSDTPTGDAIELRNTSLIPINLTNWALSDSITNRLKYHIPNVILQPGQTRVFTQAQHFGEGPNGFGLSELGDEVYLTGPPGLLGEDYGDSVVFPASPQNTSWGRYRRLDGTDALTLLATPTLGSPAAAPAVGPIVISEIMYDPAAGDEEFIELHNVSALTIPLFDPLRPANTWRLSRGVVFQFPQGVTIPAGGRVLIVDDNPTTFRTENNVPASVQIFSYDGTGENLANGGEELQLSRPGEPEPPGSENPGFVPFYRADYVSYLDSDPWPTQPGGQGPSLVRRSPLLYSDDYMNWTAGVVGGSPGSGDPDLTAPRVLGVRVGGSTWALPHLTIPVGSASQLTPIPYGGIDTITISFSEPVTAMAASLGFDATGSYSATPNIGAGESATEITWTLSAPIGVDTVTLDLENQQLRDVAGNPLDGDWVDAASLFPSGNGASGGDFRFTFRVLPGDIDQDGTVDLADRRISLERQFTKSTGPFYQAEADTDRNGAISVRDLVFLRNHMGLSPPPASSPVAHSPAVPAFSSSTLTIRRRLAIATPQTVDTAIADTNDLLAYTVRRRRR
jgi:hypothetical protein